MNVNRKAITVLRRDNTGSRRNKASIEKITGKSLLNSRSLQEHPAYAYVPYNRSWGCVETIHEVPIMIMSTGLGILCKDKANPELLKAAYRALGEDNIKNSKYSMITFRVEFREGKLFIDETSFAFYKKKLSILTPLKDTIAQLPVTLFMAPDGQQWIDEKNYVQYVSNMRIVYQCSDGSVAHSYNEFKDWEYELAYHPHTPTYSQYSECQETLATVDYLVSDDGTIWRSEELLKEYQTWKENKNSGIKDGMYVGTYGSAPTFVDYASIHNAAYYSNAGLVRQEQFYGAHNFLYANSNQAVKSIDKLNGFQKVKK